MTIKAVMMQKNEEVLLPVWIAYHARLLGLANLHVFDNGSTSHAVQAKLDEIEAAGAKVIRDRNSAEDFARKGDILAERIQLLDRTDPADFYLPLDCDEFVTSLRPDGTIAFGRSELEAALQPHLRSPHVLMIAQGFDNYPNEPGVFVRNPRRKCFFAQDACRSLDIGFHRGRAITSNEMVPTPLVHLHMHYKPFAILREHARQKMAGRVAALDAATLRAHRLSRGPGFHLVEEILFESEEAYLAQMKVKYARARKYPLPGLAQALAEAGVNLPY